MKNVSIIYSRVLKFRKINFCVDIFLGPKFLITLRGHIPVNFQYFPQIPYISCIFSSLSKVLCNLPGHIFLTFGKILKIDTFLIWPPEGSFNIFCSHKQLIRIKKTWLITLLWQPLKEKLIKSQIKSATKRYICLNFISL